VEAHVPMRMKGSSRCPSVSVSERLGVASDDIPGKILYALADGNKGRFDAGV
jgi:hypothetical protein